MTFQNAIFDLDGTLIRSEPYWRRSQLDALEQVYHFKTPEEKLPELLAMWHDDLMEYIRNEYGFPVDRSDVIDLWRSNMGEYYRTVDIPEVPGAMAFLRNLKAAGIKMAIATSTTRALCTCQVERKGILSLVDGNLFTTEQTAHGKADGSDVFDLALEALGGTKENTVVFEDTLACIRTCAKAGYRVITVENPMQKRHSEEIQRLSEYHIESFDEVYERYELQRFE